MKIAIINTLYAPYKIGGAEVSVQLLAEALAASGNDISVITLTENKEREVSILNGVKVYRVPLRNIYWPFSKVVHGAFKKFMWHLIDAYNFGARRDVYKLLRDMAPDIVYTNNISGFSVSIWDAASRLRVPIVHTSRDYYLIHPNTKLYSNDSVQNPRSIQIKLWSFLKKIKSKQVGLYLPISDYIGGLHSDLGFFENAKKTTVYNSIDMPTLLPKSDKQKTSTNTVLGFIGRIDPSKGLENILDALSKLGSEYELIIAGTGQEDYMLGLKARNTIQKVYWLGASSPSEFFPKVDILIVPSLWEEPLGRVVLESYSYGVPVITSRSGGMPEIVISGKTGYCYDKNNPQALADTIKGFNLHRKIETYDNCLRYAKEFTREQVRIKYITEMTTLKDSKFYHS